MKIYIYVDNYSPQGDDFTYGGIRKVVDGFAAGLVACGAEVIVLCEGSQESIFQTTSGYKIACFANTSHELWFDVPKKFQKYLYENAKDSLVILNGVFHRRVYALSRFLKKNQIAYIVAPHEPYHPALFQKNAHLKWPYWYLLEKRMLKHARAIQLLDIRHAKYLNSLQVNTPFLEVPNGFSITELHSDSDFEWREKGIPKLFFFGRIDVYHKGLDLLLDAFAEVTEVCNCQLTIQGPDWGERKELEAKSAHLGLSRRVFFIEPDFDKSPPLIIAEYDIFCISSRFEGFSLSALEAMLAGRVLLVSEVAGIAPHVQKSGCGVLIKPEISSIKAGIIELLECRSQWQEMGLRGRQYVLENLHWHKIASRTLEQYKSLMA
ncbi:glycosyltransferase [Calothrix sp. PCC 7507]|uniref:glycosyltransferase n=1 Tax=Calothrix sp. PCC 7507 TaxID=99598 RepID=UPI00029F155A|nr:glycosyltransferase [Calothrix sp. PCC 7507]AFY36222.1 glycosyl transferase group 1 [Calothrix sp. PCC 7507]